LPRWGPRARGRRLIFIGGDCWAPRPVGDIDTPRWFLCRLDGVFSPGRRIGSVCAFKGGRRTYFLRRDEIPHGRGKPEARERGRRLAGPDACPMLLRLLRLVVREVQRTLPLGTRFTPSNPETTLEELLR
jgi:hypothetical protein